MALEGEDLSKWQSTGSVDGAPDFVILKATEGTSYVDPDCDNKYQRAKKEGKLLGVYHFADMRDATAEADFFVNNTEGYWSKREAILVLDFETNTNVAWAKQWLDRVYARTGVRPLIYMSASTIKAANWQSVVNGNYGLWVAGYPAKYNVSHPAETDGSDMPYSISPWTFAAIWQYSSSAGALDEDVAMMSRTAWGLYAGQSAPAPAPAPKPVVTVKTETDTKTVPFNKVSQNDSTLAVGTSKISVAGVNGIETLTYKVTYTDGKETARQLTDDSVTTKPVDEITLVGTKQPVITLPVEPALQPQPTPAPEPHPIDSQPNVKTNFFKAIAIAVVDFLKALLDKLLHRG